MRSELIPFDSPLPEEWTSSTRRVDVDVSPGEERAVVELAGNPALVYEPPVRPAGGAVQDDWPERVSIYHGHMRLQMSLTEWDWLKKQVDTVIKVGRVNFEGLKERHGIDTLVPSRLR
jgi:hypothetical protein